METGTCYRTPGDRGALAPIWIRALLACPVKSRASDRQKEDFQGSARSDLSDGDREPNLGCTTYSRGAFDARF